MADHFNFIEEFDKHNWSDMSHAIEQTKTKAILLKLAVKSADISNACKPHNLAKKWALGIMDEFYKQV